MRRLIALLVAVGCDGPRDAGSADAQPRSDAAVDDAVSTDARPDARMVVDDPCFPSPGPGHRLYACNGIDFDIEVPAQCVAGGCGLIVDVHGMTMSAAMQDANTELRARGGAAGFIVIQPNANPDPPQASWSVTDDPHVFDFLTRAIAVYAVDPDRVHMTGFSQGGNMSWRFICQHADTFASVAPAAAASNCASGGGLGPMIPACSFTGSEVPSRELPILYMHGRAEQNYIPWTCAQPQVDAVVAAWGLTPEGVVESSATHTRTRWSDASGTVLEFLAHDYFSNQQVPLISQTKLQGHCVPGSTDPGGKPGQLFSFKCEQAASFVWGVEVVEFFVAHPR